ncbi:MAG: hypothetical protein C0467_30120 [Planctomycetaceae bacterium]|nr:hypothetical protein [Planctomycetaceae bacterium]
MMHHVAGVLTAITICLGLSGCGSKPDDDKAAPAASPAEPESVAKKGSEKAKSSAPAAGEPTKPVFDWTQSTSPGDVTEQIRGNLRHGTLDLVVAKIVLTPSVQLVKAEIDPKSLVLTIRVDAPEQVVRFEGMVGALGHYSPQGAQLRPVSIPKDPHSERFQRKGVLQIGIRHPHPERIQVALNRPPARPPLSEIPRPTPPDPSQYKPFPGQPTEPAVKIDPLLPDPSTGYKPRSEVFSQLAATVSYQYTMPGRDTTKWSKEFWRKHAVQAGAKYPDPGVQKYASAILARAKSDLALDPQSLRAQLLRDADTLGSKTLGFGALKGYGPGGEPVFARGNEPDPAAQAEAQRLRRIAQMSDAELKEWATKQRDQNSFEDLFFGDGVTNNREDQYKNLVGDAYKALAAEAKKTAGPSSKTSLVKLTRPDSSRFTLRNTSGRTLTDVWLSTNWAFTKSDKANEFGRGNGMFIFIPIWKSNEDVELTLIPREPSVLQTVVSLYAREASFEGDKFTLLDPKNPNLR